MKTTSMSNDNTIFLETPKCVIKAELYTNEQGCSGIKITTDSVDEKPVVLLELNSENKIRTAIYDNNSDKPVSEKNYVVKDKNHNDTNDVSADIRTTMLMSYDKDDDNYDIVETFASVNDAIDYASVFINGLSPFQTNIDWLEIWNDKNQKIAVISVPDGEVCYRMRIPDIERYPHLFNMMYVLLPNQDTPVMANTNTDALNAFIAQPGDALGNLVCGTNKLANIMHDIANEISDKNFIIVEEPCSDNHNMSLSLNDENFYELSDFAETIRQDTNKENVIVIQNVDHWIIHSQMSRLSAQLKFTRCMKRLSESNKVILHNASNTIREYNPLRMTSVDIKI